MRKTKITAWAVLAAFAGFLAVGPGLASAQSKEPVKVGMIQPLSGPIAAAGSYITNGAKIALDRVNAKGGVLGRPLELIIEDNGAGPRGAIRPDVRSGFGLTLIRGLAMQLGGEADVSSREGGGTRVSVTFAKPEEPETDA